MVPELLEVEVAPAGWAYAPLPRSVSMEPRGEETMAVV